MIKLFRDFFKFQKIIIIVSPNFCLSIFFQVTHFTVKEIEV